MQPPITMNIIAAWRSTTLVGNTVSPYDRTMMHMANSTESMYIS